MPSDVPLVLQLQADALGSTVPVADLLKRAKVVAAKLAVGNAVTWINREINGYRDLKGFDLPAYRVLRGSPRFFNPARGWCPIIAEDAEMNKMCSIAHFFEPAGVLENLVRSNPDSNVQMPHTPALGLYLAQQIGLPVQTAIMISSSAVGGIIENVKVLVVDWTLELEAAGVRGEGMSFTVGEKAMATGVTNNYFAQNIGVLGDVSGQSSVNNNQVSRSQSIDIAATSDFLAQLQQVSQMFPASTRHQLAGHMDELSQELKQPKPNKGKIAQLLTSLRTICEGLSGNLIASGVVEGIKAIFGS